MEGERLSLSRLISRRETLGWSWTPTLLGAPLWSASAQKPGGREKAVRTRAGQLVHGSECRTGKCKSCTLTTEASDKKRLLGGIEKRSRNEVSLVEGGTSQSLCNQSNQSKNQSTLVFESAKTHRSDYRVCRVALRDVVLCFPVQQDRTRTRALVRSVTSKS